MLASFIVWALFALAADFDVLDQAEFRKVIAADAKILRLATGMKFTEGPVWINEAGGSLVFSDIPANELKRWDAKGGVTTFRRPSNNANGNTVDLEGRLLTAEHGGRVSRTEKNGQVTTVVDRFNGKRLNSPNDVVVTSDAAIWLTDPDYGLGGRAKELDGNYVYRFDPKTKALTPVIKDFDKPNGLCFSPDESKLYVADSGKPRHIRVFMVGLNGRVDGGKVFASIDKGLPDGIRCDAEGRVWSSSGDGAQIFSPSGKLIGRILLPESAANLTFGGKNGTTLYLTAQTSLYAVETKTRMAQPKKR
jgi:gluconolactonase